MPLIRQMVTGIVTLGGVGGRNYFQKVLATESSNLIAYWPLNEKTGSTANDVSGNARHGSYTGVTLGSTGIGDGFDCPFFDGANDYVNVYSVSLRDAFNGAEGTAMIWAKVFNVGVWTDATFRRTVMLNVDNNNRVTLFHGRINDNSLQSVYGAGGTLETRDSAGHAETTWLHFAITWSKSTGVTGEVRHYINAVQEGATDTNLGVWVGNLVSTTTVIGANDTDPTFVWHGYLAHPAIWDTPLTPTQIAQLAVV